MYKFLDSSGLSFLWGQLKTKFPLLDANGKVPKSQLPNIPSKTSEITNDSGFVNTSGVIAAVSAHNSAADAHTALFSSKLNEPVGGEQGQVLTKTDNGAVWASPGDPDFTGYQTQTILDSGGYFLTDTVEGALSEAGAKLCDTDALIKRGQANGVCPLNSSGKIADTYLPSADYIVSSGTDANGWRYVKYKSGRFTAVKQVFFSGITPSNPSANAFYSIHTTSIPETALTAAIYHATNATNHARWVAGCAVNDGLLAITMCGMFSYTSVTVDLFVEATYN